MSDIIERLRGGDIIERLRESGLRSEIELHEDREEAAALIEELEAQVSTPVTVSEEHIAARLWRAQAIGTGTPQSLVDARTPEAFKDQSEETRKTWLKFARTAIRAIQENDDE